jgi:hypothetical protein
MKHVLVLLNAIFPRILVSIDKQLASKGLFLWLKELAAGATEVVTRHLVANAGRHNMGTASLWLVRGWKSSGPLIVITDNRK